MQELQEVKALLDEINEAISGYDPVLKERARDLLLERAFGARAGRGAGVGMGMTDTTSLSDFKATSLDGEPVDLASYAGQVVLIVNTASQCGFTPQYKGLQKLYDEYGDQGLTILGFPNLSRPGILDALNHLDFGYRWVTRFIALDKTEATKALTRNASV